MANDVNWRFEETSLSTVTTFMSVVLVFKPSLLTVLELMTSRSAPVSIIQFTKQHLSVSVLMMHIGTMGRMTLSSAVTMQLDKVAASHAISSCTGAEGCFLDDWAALTASPLLKALTGS